MDGYLHQLLQTKRRRPKRARGYGACRHASDQRGRLFARMVPSPDLCSAMLLQNGRRVVSMGSRCRSSFSQWFSSCREQPDSAGEWEGPPPKVPARYAVLPPQPQICPAPANLALDGGSILPSSCPGTWGDLPANQRDCWSHRPTKISIAPFFSFLLFFFFFFFLHVKRLSY